MPQPHEKIKDILVKEMVKAFKDAVEESVKDSPEKPDLTKANEQATKLGEAVAKAVAAALKDLKIKTEVKIIPAEIAPPAAIATAGSPAAQTSVTPSPTSPVTLSLPAFGEVM